MIMELTWPKYFKLEWPSEDVLNFPFEGPYYFWEPFGLDPDEPGQPMYRQLRTRSWNVWELANWGFWPHGLGDTCWRMGLYVACHPEDEVAIRTLFYMLKNRLRYLGSRPERAIPWYEKWRRYRHPKYGFTRDQWIAGIFGLTVAGRIDLVKQLPNRFMLSPLQYAGPGLRNWVRYLQTGKPKYAKRFHMWTLTEYTVYNRLKTLPFFARHLTSLQMFVVPNETVSKRVMHGVPTENIFLHILNDYNHGMILMYNPDRYVPTKGWAAQREDFQKGLPEMDTTEDILLDKEFLNRIITLWVRKKTANSKQMARMNAALRRGSLKGSQN